MEEKEKKTRKKKKSDKKSGKEKTKKSKTREVFDPLKDYSNTDEAFLL